MNTYESILRRIEALRPSTSVLERQVEWLSPSGVLGIARTLDGRIEVFLVGPELIPKSRTIKRALDYQTWHRLAGEPSVNASRLLLPRAGHFDQVAAFICAELIRLGADQDVSEAFSRCEPLIDLAIARLRMTDEALLGLMGEMLLLDALLRQGRRDHVEEVIESWKGWRRSIRDFSVGMVGVEVKTTTRLSSSHEVQGMHQLELASAKGTEKGLRLVSVGLEWIDDSSRASYTLPKLVQSIVEMIADAAEVASPDTTETLLDHIGAYGGDDDVGYDHRSMSGSAVFLHPFALRFVRAYDMTDPSVEVLRSLDLSRYRHVNAQSVRFQVELPDRIRGDVNPVVGLNAAAASIHLEGFGG